MVKLLSRQVFLRLMKLLLCQFLVISIAFANTTNGQSNGPLKDIHIGLSSQYTIESLFSHIESNTDLTFSYDRKDLKGALKTEITFKRGADYSVEEILLRVSELSGLRFKRINNTINVLKTTVEHQSNVIEEAYPLSGTIKDESGMGLPGATVQLKGSNLGAITDIEGNFSLKVNRTLLEVTAWITTICHINSRDLIEEGWIAFLVKVIPLELNTLSPGLCSWPFGSIRFQHCHTRRLAG